MENNSKTLNEQTTVIVGCVNDELIEKIKHLVEEENNGKVVLTHPASVYDYLEQNGVETTRSKKNGIERLTEFLYSPKNRKWAEEQALTLWNILTNNAPLEDAQNRVLSKQMISNMTTLKDYKDINQLLEFLSAFGYVEFTKENATYEFRMIFGKETRKASYKVDIIECCEKLNNAISKYKAVLKSDFEMTEDEIADEVIQLKTDVDKLIKF
nr:MAG TPA: hypothetical protein [Caudoviricetes sp.]